MIKEIKDFLKAVRKMWESPEIVEEITFDKKAKKKKKKTKSKKRSKKSATKKITTKRRNTKKN